MNIRLTYETLDGARHTVALSPDDYFDPLEPGEGYWHDGVERCDQLHDYLEVPAVRLRWLVARISEGGQVRQRRAQYLSGDAVMMEHTIDEQGEEEIILSVCLPSGDWHITRVFKPGEQSWSVVNSSLIQDETDGAGALSADLCSDWTYQQRLAFCSVGAEPTETR